MNQLLKSKNLHERDSEIKFYEKGHRYEIISDLKSKHISVTTWAHKHFPKFDAEQIIENIFKSKGWGPEHKYWGQTAEQIKALWNTSGREAASAGTSLHQRIENFMNNEHCQNYHMNFINWTTHKDLYETYCADDCDTKEWEYFLRFIKDHPEMTPYRTEWMIFDEDLKIAGSIDMVYENPDGTLSIYDWKRCKDISKINDWNKFSINPLICHMPDTNFWHYALQLNTYRAILERKYNKKVTKLCLVRLHPDAMEETYELLEVPILTKEMEDLLEERMNEVSL